MPGYAPRRRWLLPLPFLVLAAACVTTTVASQSELAPAMVVERFLRAANSNDIDTMGRLFGTSAGPVAARDSRKEVDDRMFVLASVLRHTDYQILNEQIVPGRRQEATQLVVRIVNGERRYELPITLVQTERWGWLIENIPLDRITNRPGQ
jgi:hypothetical protein